MSFIDIPFSFHSFRELPVSEYQSCDSALLHPWCRSNAHVRKQDYYIPSAPGATSYIAS